jgi:hypothetical protein
MDPNALHIALHIGRLFGAGAHHQCKSTERKEILKIHRRFCGVLAAADEFYRTKIGSLDYFGCKGTTIFTHTREKVVKEPRLTIFYNILSGSIVK